MSQGLQLEIDSAGIAWIMFDDPGAKVNLLSAAVLERLEGLFDELQANPPAGVVIGSAKSGTFIAGADIKELAKIDSVAQAEAASRAGQRIFGKLESLGVPTVAAIDGACLGGGLELVLACRYRVATDNPQTQLGLPETQLGIIPGWGGSQRLPRLIGLRAALEMIVPGTTVNASKALRIGLVDAVVPAVALQAAAKTFIRGAPSLANSVPWAPRLRVGATGPARSGIAVALRPRSGPAGNRSHNDRRYCHGAFDFIVRLLAKRRTLARTHGHYPAPMKAIEVVGRGFDAEARGFAAVATTPVCKHLIRVFFLREKYSKLTVGPRKDGVEPACVAEATSAWRRPVPPIRKVGVLGAGVMGAGIAQWCSARGLTVRLKDLKAEYVAGGMKRIAAAYREGVVRRKLSALDADHGLARVHPTTEYTGFGNCDLVIEAVLERLDVKRELFRELTPRLSPECIIASNTSAIPIDELAAVTGRPERFVGLHFFNPVHKMPLVEVVQGTRTSTETLAAAVAFAKQLKKIPVIVRGTPGFLVNRLLMPYLNEAGVLLSAGVSIAAIDKAMLAFGMPMGPLRLIDEVGLDIAVDVAGELAAAFPDRMVVAPVLQKLRQAGLKGRKGGQGFYRCHGKQETPNPAFDTGTKSLSADEIQRRLLGVMIAEAKRCLAEQVVESQDDIDVALIFGTGFPPFRGGLVTYAQEAGLW